MPFRLNDFRAKVQFVTAANMPYRVYQACLKTGIVSNTRYYQLAVCEALSRDLGIPLEDLIAELPTTRGPSGHLFDPTEQVMGKKKSIAEDQTGGVIRVGAGNTIETVK